MSAPTKKDESSPVFFLRRSFHVMARFFRARFDRLFFHWRYNRFSLIVSFFTLACLVTSTYQFNSLNTQTTVISAILSLIILILWLVQKFSSLLVPLSHPIPRAISWGPTSSIIANRNESLLTDNDVNLRLDNMLNRVELLVHAYALPERIRGWASTILRQKRTKLLTINEAKISLRTDINGWLLNEETRPVNIQKTSYYDGIITNETFGSELVTRDFTGRANSNTREIYNFSDLAFKDNKLISLEKSDASNHIGGSTLAISTDACVLYQTQGNQNEIGALQIFPSGSGSFDWNESQLALQVPKLRDLVELNLERELREEMCVPDDRDYRCLTFVIGYGRILSRNGKPEFLGLTLVNKSHDEFRIRPAERGYVYKIHALKLESLKTAKVHRRLSDFYSEMQSSSNAGLGILTTLHCAIKFLEHQTDDDWFEKGFAQFKDHDEL